MLPVVTAEQMRAWDSFTIEREPISSYDLMERAAQACADWIFLQRWEEKEFAVFCGRGNNGGDGLAVARLLAAKDYKIKVYVLPGAGNDSPDFKKNLEIWKSGHAIEEIKGENNFPPIDKNTIVIDALFGTGLNKSLTGVAADLVSYINDSPGCKTVSIDMPGGLFADTISGKGPVVRADHTLTFQTYKTALLIQESGPYIGEVHVLDISLSRAFLNTIKINRQVIDKAYIQQIYKPRQTFAHKGTYGHALLIAGSWGKMGAAVLAARACLHAGPGLLTCHIPVCGNTIMQTAVPEAMVIMDENGYIVTKPENLEKYKITGVGPGLGTGEKTQKAIALLIEGSKQPLIIDADGLNCLAKQPHLLQLLPAGSVLTPHPKEFDRLFGEHADDFARAEKAEQKAAELKIIIVLKSHHTLIATPSGLSFFNNTGNAGMAKGGSGDVLTGIITGLAAQTYSTEEAAIFGVYLHGLAGDLAAEEHGMEAMTPTHLISYLGKAYLTLKPVIRK